MTRKTIAFPSAPPAGRSPATAWDPDSWVFVDEQGRKAADAAAGAPRDRAPPVPPPGLEPVQAYLARLAACRTPADLMALQLWAFRVQAEAGFALGSRYAQAFADAAASAARAVAPR